MMHLPNRARCMLVLGELFRRCEGVSAALLALRDGRPFVGKTRSPVDNGKFAALASSLAALSQSVLREVGAGMLGHVTIEGEHGRLVVCSVPGKDTQLILAVHTDLEVKLGLVLAQTRSCARDVAASAREPEQG